MFFTVPFTRNGPCACESVLTRRICSCGAMFSPHTCAKPRKKRCSGVKPSMVRCGFPCSDFSYARYASVAPPRSAIASPCTSSPLMFIPPGIVGVRIVERRLQDAGREGDVVARRVVRGVHGRRREAGPLVRIVGLADALDVALIRPPARGEDVLRVRGVCDLERAVVAPLVGVADAALEGVQLFERGLLRLRPH